MRYTVTWLPGPTQELARIWNSASDRGAVASAANQIDLALKYFPDTQGQPFDSEWQITFDPLTVVYDFSPDDLVVRVIDVYVTG